MEIKKKRLAVSFAGIALAGLLFFSLVYLDFVKLDSFATQNDVGITIILDDNAPDVNITNPINDTYNYWDDISLHYSIYDLSPVNVWYSINGGPNVTLSGNTTFNASIGANTLILYANDSLGRLNSTRISFSVNVTRGDTVYVKNDDLFGSGSQTTNISNLDTSQRSGIANLTLHNVFSAMVVFTEAVNLSYHGNRSGVLVNEVLNLTRFVNISENRVFIDSSLFNALNRSARITLYNLTFTDPSVLMDGVACPAAVCQEINYSIGDFTFNVSHFTVFSAAEGYSPPSEAPSAGAGGGGGGGGGSPYSKVIEEYKEFVIAEPVVHLSSRNMQPSLKMLAIRNPNKFAINLSFHINPVISFLDIEGKRDSYEAKLEGLEEKTLVIRIKPVNETLPGSYITKLTVNDAKTTKEVLILVDYSVGEELLDTNMELLDDFKVVRPGTKVCTEFAMFNLGKTKRIDVPLEYYIKDTGSRVIVSKLETLALETQLTKLLCLVLPIDVPRGEYLFVSEVKYRDGTAVSSKNFRVDGEPDRLFLFKSALLDYRTLVILLLVVIIVLLSRRRKRAVKARPRIRMPHMPKVRFNLLRRLFERKKGRQIIRIVKCPYCEATLDPNSVIKEKVQIGFGKSKLVYSCPRCSSVLEDYKEKY